MYFMYAEKLSNSFFQQWDMRLVAFDSSRRYLYYSAALPPRSKGTESDEDLEAEESEDYVDGPSFKYPRTDRINLVDMTVQPKDATWKNKLKVTHVEPVMTQVEFTVLDPHLEERDLFRLRITGEVRPLAEMETPPLGPLLCPSATPTPMPERLCVDNAEQLLDDPMLLNEIFSSLREQYQKINEERCRIEADARASGQPVPVFHRQTVDSPKRRGSFFSPSKKTILLRCRNEPEFRRLWFLLQLVLGYDKLGGRPYRGLPPFDPRNGICFAHIPMYVWHTFKNLDKAIFYTLSRGLLLNCVEGPSNVKPNASGNASSSREPGGYSSLVASGSASSTSTMLRLEVVLKSSYLTITHDVLLVMTDPGNFPRWVPLQEVDCFHYNVVSHQPFVAFLTDEGAPDIVFVPQPPAFGADAIRNYDPQFEVLRIAKVMRDACFASCTIRRVIKMTEVADHSVSAYARRMAREGRPLVTAASPAYVKMNAGGCLVEREQLASVWQHVQSYLLQQSAAGQDNLAIPIYTDTATQINLTPEELLQLNRRLEAERESAHDVVGVVLSSMRRAAENAPMSAIEGNDAAGGLSLQDSEAFVSASDAAAVVMPLSAEILHTPQMMGDRFARPVSRDSLDSGYFSSYPNYEPRRTVKPEEEHDGVPLH